MAAMLVCMGWVAFPWLLSLPPGPTLLSWPSGGPLVLDTHQPWAFGGFNPCVFGGVSPFSLLFSRPLSMSITPSIPNPTYLTNTAAARGRTLRQTLPDLCSLPSTTTPVWWAVALPLVLFSIHAPSPQWPS